ncbi:MAG: class I SAM-dependent methyltransferase [Acidobacteriota bacterium]|nr:class I SAM-dependent methyltransferase [Acidobacteriota bacterium]MDE2923051.1 class I SAM-dependent methyltransferase [Acidobacteriota bacterium]MDE3266303.1 class I SAM-dependent methyltransferase [Acidobacteriota bacterium]
MLSLVRRVRGGSKAAAYRLTKGLLRRFGYDFEIFPRSRRDAQAVKNADESFYREWRSPSPVWTPWRGEPDFREAYDGVEPYTVVSADRCQVLYRLGNQALSLDGDFAECGVYRGGTALLLSRVLEGHPKTLHLFDSFEGLPAPDPERDPDLEQGVFKATSARAVGALLGGFADSLRIHEGWIPSTFDGLEDSRFAFVHIDVDLYRSTLDCLEYFYPRLSVGGIVVFDDYGFPAARGEKDAVDEFFLGRQEAPLALPTGQAIVTKLP